MQLRHGDNLGKGFCRSTSAYKSQRECRRHRCCDVCTKGEIRHSPIQDYKSINNNDFGKLKNLWSIRGKTLCTFSLEAPCLGLTDLKKGFLCHLFFLEMARIIKINPMLL